MLLIGLTGGIASGKTTVAGMLGRQGAVVLDADQIAREVVSPGRPAWREITARFGDAVIAADGSVDRARLGELVFNDPSLLRELNAIVHPRVGQELASRTDEIRRRQPEAVLIYDVPLLIEAGMQNAVDLVLLVYVSPDVQLKRLRERDGFSEEEALARIGSQMPLDDKRKYADAVIDNSGSLEETAGQVRRFWYKLTGSDNKRQTGSTCRREVRKSCPEE